MKSTDIRTTQKKISALLNAGQVAEAEKHLETIAHSPSVDADTLFLLAQVRAQRNKIGLVEETLLEALALDTNHIEANIMLAKHFLTSSQAKLALKTAEHVLSIQPHNIEALLTRAYALQKEHNIAEAMLCLQDAIKRYPKNAEICNNLGNLYLALSDIPEAIHWYQKAHEFNPSNPLAYSNLTSAIHYHPSFSFAEINQICRERGAYFNTKKKPQTKHFASIEKQPNRRLNIGFISDGFRRHPVGYMVTATLEQLPDEQFRIFAYSTNDHEDNITQRIKQVVDEWIPIARHSDAELDKLIRNAKIDILIDLSGHMSGTRMQTIAMKPSPIIVKWVGGLINTTGVAAIDYLISDHIETPMNTDQFYTEKLIRLPNDYVCYEPPLYAPDIAPLPFDTNGYITFGCFNNGTKISLELLTEWSGILKQVKNSRLLLKSTQYNVAELKRKIWNHFESLGIDPSRIIIEGPSKHLMLLDTYNRVDIALDSWPYSGGLTTCEALYMGVPVVTYPGPTFAGRHSATHLHNAGLAELVTDSWDEFKDRVVGLTEDIASLRTIRAHLRTIVLSSQLCNIDEFAKDFSSALSAIWNRYCNGKSPAALSFSKSGVMQFADEAKPVVLKSIAPKPRQARAKAIKQGEFSWQFSGQVVVLDNACSVLLKPNFLELRSLGAFAVVTLDPASQLKNVSEFNSDKNIEIHQHVQLGDGNQTNLYACLDNRFSSVLEPLPSVKQSDHAQSPSTILATVPMPTVAVDLIKGLPSIDTIILSELSDVKTILANGENSLKHTFIVQIRVALQATHRGQTSLDEINSWAMQHGFRFYTLTNYEYAENSNAAFCMQDKELFKADAIYIPTDERMANMDSSAIEKFAFACDQLFELKDLAFKLLKEYIPEKSERYLQYAKAALLSSEVAVNEVINNNKPLMPKPHGLEHKLIISVAANPEHFDTLAYTLRCLLNQTITPDHIVLWVADSDKEALPKNVIALKQFGIQIRYYADAALCKKILLAIETFKDSFIATAEDNIYYWPTWLEELVASYSKHEKSIPAHRVDKIELASNNDPMKYQDWQHNVKAIGKAHPLFIANSYAGALYPPQVLQCVSKLHDESAAISSGTHDVWLYWVIRAEGYQYKHTGSQKLMTWNPNQEDRLFDESAVNTNVELMLNRFTSTIFSMAKEAADTKLINLPDAPFMSSAEQALFKAYLAKATEYFEFGAGGSTVWAVEHGLEVRGIESDMNWINGLNDKLGRQCLIEFADIGPTGDWGYPISNKFIGKFKSYSASILKHDRDFDFILIDGRFRVACLLSTLIYLLTKHSHPSKACIFIHDFWNRQESYSPVLDFVDEIASAESAGVFKIKEDLDLAKVRSLWKKYKDIPD